MSDPLPGHADSRSVMNEITLNVLKATIKTFMMVKFIKPPGNYFIDYHFIARGFSTP